jgi:hypothetical protein
MISNVTDRKKFLDALQEISNSFTRIEAEKDFIKDVVNNLVEEFELPKKTINKLARIYQKNHSFKQIDLLMRCSNAEELTESLII